MGWIKLKNDPDGSTRRMPDGRYEVRCYCWKVVRGNPVMVKGVVGSLHDAYVWMDNHHHGFETRELAEAELRRRGINASGKGPGIRKVSKMLTVREIQRRKREQEIGW